MMLNRQRQCLSCSVVVEDVPPPAAPMAEDQRTRENFFPKGLRVLLVDGDTVCLAVLERMLLQCDYNVTACTRVSEAISLVMEKRHRFDIVMSDVYLPNADGFKLLDTVGIGFGVPVIMMSANSETDVVMRSIRGGACNHMLKPIRMEELHTIWQHVIRSHGQQNHRHNLQKSHGDLSGDGRVWGESTASKKRKHGGGQVVQHINSLKTGRVLHWTDQLHRKFVKAVNQTGVDNAAPKKILEIMNIEGLTRENVASHLQKYRLYLNRLRGSIPEPRPVASFQAATDGKSGGTMQILPRRKTSRSPSSALKAFPSRLELVRGLDPATLKLLQQFKANEQKLAANRAQRLRRLAAAAATPSYRSTNNVGNQNAQKSTDESRNIDEEELQFNNFVEEEFHGVTFPLIHDQMPTLTAAAGYLPEEYVMLANNFLSQVG